MKKFWKALGIAALAAVVPVRFKKDEETGKKTFQSLLWKLDVGSTDDGETEIGLDLMEGVITAPLMNAINAKQEAELFTDDPEEAVLFADDDPAAAVVETAAEKAGEVAEAVEAKVEELEAKAEEVVEDDFDPEF